MKTITIITTYGQIRFRGKARPKLDDAHYFFFETHRGNFCKIRKDALIIACEQTRGDSEIEGI